jgi:hypothetical protein
MEDVAWNHVLDQHVEMSEYLAETMTAIELPDHPNQILKRGANATSAVDRCAGFGWSRSSAAASTGFVTAFPQSNDVNAKWLVERDGKIPVTVPNLIETNADDLAAVLAIA